MTRVPIISILIVSNQDTGETIVGKSASCSICATAKSQANNEIFFCSSLLLVRKGICACVRMTQILASP